MPNVEEAVNTASSTLTRRRCTRGARRWRTRSTPIVAATLHGAYRDVPPTGSVTMLSSNPAISGIARSIAARTAGSASDAS